MDRKIQELTSIIKRLEGVLKTSVNEEQKQRVLSELRTYKTELAKARREKEQSIPSSVEQEPLFDENERASVSKTIADKNDYEILSQVDEKRLCNECRDREMNDIYSFMIFFEEELWGIISDYQLKLDFNTAQLRDKFYMDFTRVFNLLKNHSKLLDNLSERNLSKSYYEQLNQTRLKDARGIVVSFGSFIRSLHGFTKRLIQSYKDSGGLVLNPDEPLKNDDFSMLNRYKGVTIIQGLEIIEKFCAEIIDYLKVPELKRKDQLNLDLYGD